MFKKNCHNCGKPFEHKSRNAKYCDEKCREAAKKISLGRHKRRRNYKRNAEELRAASMSRSQARAHCIASHAISTCTRCGDSFKIADLEDHHRDGNPFNNTTDNLTLVCHPCHTKSDTEWRKAKDASEPIQDMRNYLQVGCVVMDTSGHLYVVVGREKILLEGI